MKCWVVLDSGPPFSLGGGGAGWGGGGGGEGDGALGLGRLLFGVASGEGVFNRVGDWTLGKGPIGCWLTNDKWASMGRLETDA